MDLRGEELIEIMTELGTDLNREMGEIVLSTMHGINHISIGGRKLGQIRIEHLTLCKSSRITSGEAGKDNMDVGTLLVRLDKLIKRLLTNLFELHVTGGIKGRGVENLIRVPRVNINPGVILDGLRNGTEHHQKSISFTTRIYSSEVTTNSWTATAVRLASGRVLQGKEARLRPSFIIST
jgi:hypothetical protein